MCDAEEWGERISSARLRRAHLAGKFGVAVGRGGGTKEPTVSGKSVSVSDSIGEYEGIT